MARPGSGAFCRRGDKKDGHWYQSGTGPGYAGPHPDAREIISASNRLNKEYVVFSLPMDVPRALKELEPKGVMVIFENKKTNMQAALEILCRKEEPRGRFPYRLTLPERYDLKNY
jgi:hypothetical protein